MFGQLAALGLAALFLVCAFAVGSRLLAAIGAEPRPVDRLTFATAIGTGAYGVLMLALAAAGLLHVAALWLAVLLPAALCLGESRRLPGALAGVRALFADHRGASGAALASGGIERLLAPSFAAVVALLLVLGALAPTTDWDSLMYHLELPRAFLEAGRLHVPPDGLHVAYLGLVQMLFLPFLALGLTAAPALLNAALAMLLGVAVLSAGERFFGRAAGLGGFLALWGSSSVLLVATTARIDVSLAFYLFLAHYAVLLALEEQERWAPVTAAILGGIAIGAKYHALPFLAALAPFAAWSVLRSARGGEPAARAWTRAAACVGIALAVALPWIVKNWVLFGAPLYPFMAERIVPPWIAGLLGSASHPAGVTTDIYGALGRARESVSIGALLLRPTALTVEGEALAYTRNITLFLLPLALLLPRRRLMAALLAPGALYLLFALGPFAKTNLRYLMPVIPAFALLAAAGALSAVARLSRPDAARRTALALIALAAVPALLVTGRLVLDPLRLAGALGIHPPHRYLLASPDAGFTLHHTATLWMNNNLPEGSRVLMLFEARGFYSTHATVQDNVLTNWPLFTATPAFDGCLAGTGITHVYVNHGAAAYYQARGLDLGILSWDRFPAFAERCLATVAGLGGIQVLRVR